MRQLHICSQGHRWDPLLDQRPSEDERFNRCPECGSTVDAFSIRDTSDNPGMQVVESPEAAPPQAPAAKPHIEGYALLCEIGRGGMGVIYKARQIATNRIVALKMISAGHQASESDLVRFQKEIKAVSRLQHDHIVQIYEVGEQNGSPFYALEYMDGGTLESRLVGGTPMPARYAAELIEILANAMQIAHNQGIVHRDLKPANILLTSAKSPSADTVVYLLGTPKISDFGLAKHIDDDQRQTKSGAIMGTPSYMAPEQAEGKAKTVGPAADIYALGAILYECLTGRPPFRGATILETLEQVRSSDPIPPSRIRPETPRPLETICLKALAKDPAQRYSSAESFAEDLRRYLGGNKVLAKPAGIATQVGKWLHKRKSFVATIAGVVIAAVGIGMGLYLMNQGRLPVVEHSPTVAPIPSTTTAIEYYRAITVRRGIPEGIGGLDEQQARRMPSSFRFTKRNGRVERVEAVDHLGLPTTEHEFDRALFRRADAFRRNESDDNETETRWDYQYDQQGVLLKETAFDATGGIVWTAQWSFPANNLASSRYLDDRDNDKITVPSGASRVEYTFDDAGFVLKERYLTSRGLPRPGEQGVFGRRFLRDERGLPLETIGLGSNGQDEMLNNRGVLTERRQFDPLGLEIEVAHYSFDDKPTSSGEVVLGRPSSKTRTVIKRDPDGRPVEVRSVFVDRVALPSTSKANDDNRRKAADVFTYDDLGRLVSISHLDQDGKPIQHNNGYAKVVYDYDEHGNRIRVTQLDNEGVPFSIRARNTNTNGGAVGLSYRYDKRGRLVETTYVDQEGKPVMRPTSRAPFGGGLDSRNWSRETLTLDDAGRVLEVAYTDAEGNPAFEMSTYASRLRFTYNERGRITSVEFLDRNASPLELGGVARVQLEYDTTGNVSSQCHFNSAGQPSLPRQRVIGSSLYHRRIRIVEAVKVVYRYDERGNLTETAYFDAENRPCDRQVSIEGMKTAFSTVQSKYDENGNRIETAYRSVDGRLVAHATLNGRDLIVARTEWEYDTFGNLVSLKNFDENNVLLVDNDGIAFMRVEFDSRCRITSQRFFGRDNKPIEFRRIYTRVESTPPTRIPFGGRRSRTVAIPVERGYARIDFMYEGVILVSSTYFDKADNVVPTLPVVTTALRPTSDRTLLGTMQLKQLADATGGLQPGDILIKYEGQPVSCARQFLRSKDAEVADGSTRDLEIRRQGKPQTIKLPSGPLSMLRPETGALPPKTGTIRSADPNDPVRRFGLIDGPNTWFSLQTIVAEPETK